MEKKSLQKERKVVKQQQHDSIMQRQKFRKSFTTIFDLVGSKFSSVSKTFQLFGGISRLEMEQWIENHNKASSTDVETYTRNIHANI